MATARPSYYCHKCQSHIGVVTNSQCPRCHDTFIEEVEEQDSGPQRWNSGREAFQVHGGMPMGNATILIGGGRRGEGRQAFVTRSTNPDGQANLGHFIHSLLTQVIAGSAANASSSQASMREPGARPPVIDPNNFEAFLAQFLGQMGGEQGGPSPASESRINSIPTVSITRSQAREKLECSICMDEFKEKDQAKLLPCCHHFHEECISRWLRLHGTCPTCRVHLNGDSSEHRPNSRQSPSYPSRGNNTRSSSNAPGGQWDSFDFD